MVNFLTFVLSETQPRGASCRSEMLYSWYQIKRRGELSVGEGLVEAKCYKRRGQIKRRGGSWQGEML